VVNITKFGAFVNILPGRDGLVHISKMGGGKRIEKVEDVLELGQAIEVKVDDVDPNGKVSLSPVTPLAPGEGGGSSEAPSSGGGESSEGTSAPARETVSFEDAFDAEIREEFGELGPGAERPGGGGGDRGGRGGDRGGRGGGRRGGGGGRR
jgi:polyribonucleotide nucleotidyltransferase